MNTDFNDLPENSVKTAKLAFLDTIAVSLAGIGSEEMNILSEELIGGSDLSLLERLKEANEKDFALLFATLSHVIDYDDVNFTFHGHPSVALIPPLLTYGKFQNELSGKELILSYVIGFEVQARLGEDLGNAQYQRGMHVTSTLGIFGAAASLTKAMKLNFEQFSNLIGMCVSFSSGVRKNFGTMTKPLHVGIMASNVMLFANLVRKGFTSNPEAFSEPMSYSDVSTGSHNSLLAIKKLGEVWESADFGIIVKKYPCCAYTHRSIDSVIKLINDNDIDVSSITKVIAKVNPKVPTVLIYPNANTPAEGKFSMQYCLSAAIIDKEVNLNTFTQDRVDRSEIRVLMSKVEMEGDEAQIGVNKEQSASVTIYTADNVYHEMTEFPLGHPKNPLSEIQMFEKVADIVNENITRDNKELLLSLPKFLQDKTSADLLNMFS
ncbi:MmgE/PrpD family protein [Sporosarcina sp. P26b]|uniref:MmgE/PrpD family protein n=1 Tax=Sporosarcina sp. P26b TaxID=2048253 RepID=UPI001E40C946|nr:MmgE/PrpD family protein [Sporosarcina sp. P26b]